MKIKQLMIENITTHLINLGLDKFKSESCAKKAYSFFYREMGNSKDPYKETCDKAGLLACGMVAGFKYKSPTNKAPRRNKKPQDVWDF